MDQVAKTGHILLGAQGNLQSQEDDGLVTRGGSPLILQVLTSTWPSLGQAVF